MGSNAPDPRRPLPGTHDRFAAYRKTEISVMRTGLVAALLAAPFIAALVVQLTHPTAFSYVATLFGFP